MWDIYSCLFGKQWLNDSIIDAFSSVLQEKSQNKIILSSLLLAKDMNEVAIVDMKDWICNTTGKVHGDRFKYNGNLHDALKDIHTLMFPACFLQHWYLCVVDLKNNVATVIDGLNSDTEGNTNNLLLKVLMILQYYHENTEKKFKILI